jgi:NTP pyrophosphatase (non-canonical NTP hydrolase)
MPDDPTTLGDLTRRALAFRDARDWAQFHQPKDLVLALGIEAGELAEIFLWKSPEEIDLALQEPDFRQRLAEEIADVQIFLLYLASRTDIRISSAVDEKLAVNEARYPIHLARGSARKHDELGTAGQRPTPSPAN